ncbi:MAG: hypothetical protein AB7U63_12055, partial [Porticoccaceae bacterium]
LDCRNGFSLLGQQTSAELFYFHLREPFTIAAETCGWPMSGSGRRFCCRMAVIVKPIGFAAVQQQPHFLL